MPFALFTISIRDDGRQQQAMNDFLASHRILSVEKRFVDCGADSFWSFCADFLTHQPSATAVQRMLPGKNKVDYKEILTPEQFAVFARLRELRKQMALREAVPVYTIFTNEQLAQIVQAAPTSVAALGKIEGIGDARLEKYGEAFLSAIPTSLPRGES